MEDVIIIGGGLAGLVTSIKLASEGLKVLVIEKKEYPFHKVCGEYISNEIMPFFECIGIFPEQLGASNINRLNITTPAGKILELPLALGGFGISRYSLDFHIYQLAKRKGVDFLLNTKAVNIEPQENRFRVALSDGSSRLGKLVVGAYGKLSNLDRQLDRAFFKKKSPYMGVKYHIQTDYPDNLISLHLFKNGYCGISKIEDNKYCLCYLTVQENLKSNNTIGEMEKNVLSRNPYLKKIFNSSTFLFDKPEVINQISFEKKTTSEKHIVMAGDAVGLISPLCGNGMAMAIHSGKILSEIIIKNKRGSEFNMNGIETEYAIQWGKLFKVRLFAGQKIQQLFGNVGLTEITLTALTIFKPLGAWLIRKTHGKPFL